jgi:two-component system, sensor histidine kinase and response regulator
MTRLSKKSVKKKGPSLLESQNALLTAIINSSGDSIIFSLDKKYCYTAFNKKHREDMKKTWKTDITIGANLFDIMKGPELKAGAKNRIDRALAGEVISETRYLPEASVYYDFCWNPVYLKKKIVGVTCFIRDITERKKAEEKLKQSEEKFKTVFYTSPDAITLSRLEDGAFVSVNNGFQLLSGYSEKEVVGKTSLEINIWHDPEDRKKVFEMLRASGQVKNYKAPFQKKDGTFHYGFISAAIIDINGCKHLLSITRDISDLVQKDDALQASENELRRQAEVIQLSLDVLENREKRFEVIVDNIVDGLLAIDNDRNAMLMNRKFAEIFDKNIPECIGKNISFIINDKELLSRFQPLLQQSGTDVGEDIVSIPLRGGETHYFRAHCATIIDKADKDIGKIITLDDQTQKIRGDMLKRAFLNNVSHEMRTPVTSIIGMTEILQNEVINNEQKEYLNILADSENTLLTLIDQILDFSNLEQNAIELHMAAFSLGDLCKEKIARFSLEAQKKGIGFSWDIDPSAFRKVRGDKIRLKQILANILKNAIKFTHKGGISCTTKLHRETNGKLEFLFSISDTGIGIEKKNLNLIFKEFIQLDGASTRRYGGTGLGLALAKRLVELMNGRIWAESAAGAGSTFYFTITVEAE